jgi:hypothetical protein
VQLLLVPELRKLSAVRGLVLLHASTPFKKTVGEGAILSDTTSVVNNVVAFGTMT